MGTTYTNCQVRCDTPELVVKSLEGLLREPAYVVPAVNGWVGVYPEGGTTDTAKLAGELSERLSVPVIALMVHDSDVFCYWLYENGVLSDEFNSDPDWESDPDDEDFPPPSAEETAWMQGNPARLLPHCVPGVTPAQIQEVLHPTQSAEASRFDLSQQLPGLDKAIGPWAQLLGTTPGALREGMEQKGREKYLFADEQAADLTALLGIDEGLARSEYRDIEQMNLEDYVEKNFRLVGPGQLSQEYKNQKLWGKEPMQNPQRLRYWLSQGADPNARDAEGIPILTRWAQSCFPEQIKILLEAGANIHAVTTPSPNLQWGYGYEGGVTALMVASRATYEQPDRVPETVRLLLNSGADVNARSETGRTALAEATTMTDPAQHQGRIGRHAPEAVLQQAAERSAQIVQMLRDAGAVE